MKKILLMSIALIMFSCNNQSTKQNETSQDIITDEQEVEVKVETQPETNVPPKPEKHTWFFQICNYTGTYDANQYSNEQLENTLKYLVKGQGTMTPFSIFTPDDLKSVDKDAVEQEFNETLKNLNSLKFINTPYFNKIRKQRKKEVERIKLLSLIRIESFSNPEVLRNDSYSKEQCSEYTNALIAGGDELLAMRKKMAEKSRDEGNTGAWDRYIEETKSDNELEFARVHVSTFGWWNCVNNSIDRVNPTEAHNSGFMALFEDIKEECEEP
jgi:hypothetical protein